MNFTKMKLLLVTAGLLGAVQAQAGSFVMNVGIDSGGDRLDTVQTTKGTSSARANQGLAMNIGGVFPNNAENTFETMLTVGYKFGGVLANNGSLLWSNIPLEVSEFYRVNNMRFGIGAAYHVSNQLKYDNVPGVGDLNVNFDDALGAIVQIGWAPTNGRYTVDLRYTDIKYALKGANRKWDGSTAGIFASFRF